MATLTVTIKEELVLNGAERGSENVISISSVTEMIERIIDVPTATETTLVEYGAVTGGSKFIDDTTQYLRITNIDDTNFATLRVLGTSEEYFVKIPASGSFILFNDEMDANATGSQSASLADIESIKAQADTASVQLELFVAV
tara:strand:+ start:4672 stop:5100 length:429 start_codon:yes stop_codon:yes gene_type:complete